MNGLQLRNIVSQIKPNILHVHYASGYGTLGRLSGFRPRLLSVWGSDILLAPGQSAFLRAVVRGNLGSYDCVCATSTVLANQAKRLQPAIHEMHIVPFGIDTTVFSPLKSYRDPRLLSIGTVKRLVAEGGIDILVHAFCEARETLRLQDRMLANRMRLRIIGEGPERSRIESLVKSLGIQDVTRLEGNIPHARMNEVLNSLDIFVAPSRSESFGVAVLEASACEIPIIATRVGGLPEVVEDGATGMLVEPENPAALAKAIQTLGTNEWLRTKMGVNGRAMVVSRYEWNRSVDQMEAIYKRIADDEHSPR